MNRSHAAGAPIRHRLSELKPELSPPREALLVATLKLQKTGPAPALPPSVAARVGRRLGEHPLRQPFAPWRLAQVAAALIAALVAVEAVALVGERVVEVWRARQPVAVRAPLKRRPAAVAPLPPAVATPLPTLPTLPAAPVAMAQPSPVRAASRRAPRPVAVAPVPVVAAPPVAVAAVPAAALETLPPPPIVLDPLPPVTPPAAVDPLAVEAAQLRSGLELKRSGRLAAAAAAFAAYRSQHPQGTFWREAAVAELDAQLSLGRRDEALALLQQVGDDPSLPRSAELRLLRAELAARKGRCAEALPVFEAAFDSPALAERALYGRAGCEEALGRVADSRRSFERYLAEYPHGTLAAEARRALGL